MKHTDWREAYAVRQGDRKAAAAQTDTAYRHLIAANAVLPPADHTARDYLGTALAACLDALDAVRQHQGWDSDLYTDEEWERAS